MRNIPREIKGLLNDIKIGHIKILGDNLIGIYIHGSLAMDCFNPQSSDVDFLVVVQEKLPTETKKEIVRLLLRLSDSAPVKGFEMSIILQGDLDHFSYPTPFELHYSYLHKERYLSDPEYICGDDEDPDLAAHIYLTINRGFCLYGSPVDLVFKPIPDIYYIKSLLFDLKGVEKKITGDPIYNILNLCRVLMYLKEQKVVSKKEGGQWLLKRIGEPFSTVVLNALSVYLGKEDNPEFDHDELKVFANMMMGKINALIVKLPGIASYS